MTPPVRPEPQGGYSPDNPFAPKAAAATSTYSADNPFAPTPAASAAPIRLAPVVVNTPPPETTILSPGEETKFQEWATKNRVTDVDHPDSHYDYRGYWREVGGKPVRFGVDHFPDTYKQHGHKTFSVESKYSSGPTDGGRWEGEKFIPPGARPGESPASARIRNAYASGAGPTKPPPEAYVASERMRLRYGKAPAQVATEVDEHGQPTGATVTTGQPQPTGRVPAETIARARSGEFGLAKGAEAALSIAHAPDEAANAALSQSNRLRPATLTNLAAHTFLNAMAAPLTAGASEADTEGKLEEYTSKGGQIEPWKANLLGALAAGGAVSGQVALNKAFAGKGRLGASGSEVTATRLGIAKKASDAMRAGALKAIEDLATENEVHPSRIAHLVSESARALRARAPQLRAAAASGAAQAVQGGALTGATELAAGQRDPAQLAKDMGNAALQYGILGGAFHGLASEAQFKAGYDITKRALENAPELKAAIAKKTVGGAAGPVAGDVPSTSETYSPENPFAPSAAGAKATGRPSPGNGTKVEMTGRDQAVKREVESSDIRMARHYGATDARAGTPRNPYLPDSPHHAAYAEGVASVPRDDVGASNVLRTPPTKQGLADLGEDESLAKAAKAKEAKHPEPAEPAREYSSTQLDLPPETSKAIQAVGAKIPDADLAKDGREAQPHITVKYGLHGNEPEKVRALLAGEPPITVKLGKTSVFPADEKAVQRGGADVADVVKVDVDSPALHALNKKIADALPHTDTFPEYKPHATVAYVKPGLGEKYAGDASLEGHTVTIDKLTFSGKDGKAVEIPLAGKTNDILGNGRSNEAQVGGGEQSGGVRPESVPSGTAGAGAATAASTEGASGSRPAEVAAEPAAPALADRPHVAGHDGREGDVYFSSGTSLKARYRVVDAADLQASHDPGTFNPNPLYPEGVQGRAYHGSRGTAARQHVELETGKLRPGVLLDSGSGVTDGPPLVTPHGIVVAGNQRTMMLKRAPSAAPDAYGKYRQELLRRAESFGVSAAQVSKMDHPVLVRVIDDPSVDVNDPKALGELNRVSDQAPTKTKDQVTAAMSRADSMRGARSSLQHLTETMDPDGTVRDYLGTGAGRELVRQLVKDGVISQQELPSFVDQATNTVTANGKQLVEDMLYAAAIGDADVMARTPASTLRKIGPAVPAIVQANQAGAYNLESVLQGALDTLASAAAMRNDIGSGRRSVDDLLSQGDMFGKAPSEAVAGLARFLEQRPAADVARAMREYASLAREASEHAQSEDIFGHQPEEPKALQKRLFSPGKPPALDELAAKQETLFGDEPAPPPKQEGLFGDREGTAAARNLEAAERAARAEIPRLKEELALIDRSKLTDQVWAARRKKIALRLSDLEKLVNRGRAISAEEMANRARAGEADDLFSHDRAGASLRNPQTETEAFRRWFLDSKVVDADGKPLVVYHGTTEDFGAFALSRTGQRMGHKYGRGAIFFTSNPTVASDYATVHDALGDAHPLDRPNVIPAYLSLTKPLEIDGGGRSWSFFEDDIRRAQREGFDGVIMRNVLDHARARTERSVGAVDVFVAFRPQQVKSAIGNRGTFNPNSRVISELRTGEGTVGAGFDKSLLKKLGANMYKGDLGVIAVKEALQNASDALIGKADGVVTMRLDADKKQLAFTDNGAGMLPDVAATALMDIGGSAKAEGAAGGYGLAKVALFSRAKLIEVHTTAVDKSGKKITTTIKGTGQDWADGKLAIDEKKGVGDTGTTLRVTLDDDVQATGYAIREFVRKATAYSQLPWRIELEGDLELAGRERMPLSDQPLLTTTVPGAEVVVRGSVEIREGDSPLEVNVLNRGLYQFSNYSWNVKGVGIPKALVVDVRPTVDVENEKYPFTTSREELKKAAAGVVEQVIENLSHLGTRNDIVGLIAALNDTVDMPNTEDGEAGGDTLRLYDTSGVVPAELRTRIAESKQIQVLANAAAKAIHDLAARTRVRRQFKPFAFGGIGVAPGWLGINVDRGLLHQIAETLPAENRPKLPDKSNLILFNPLTTFKEVRGAYQRSRGLGENEGTVQEAHLPDLALRYAETMWGTIVHELAHQFARGHDEQFAGILTRMLGESTALGSRILPELETAALEAMQLKGEGTDLAALTTEVYHAWDDKTKDRLAKIGSHLGSDIGPESTSGAGRAPGGDQAGSEVQRDRGDRGRIRQGGLPRRDDVRGGAPVREGVAADQPASARAAARPAHPGNRLGGSPPRQPGGTAAGAAGASGGQRKLPEPTGLAQDRPGFRPNEIVPAIKTLFNPETLGSPAEGAAGTIRHETALGFRELTVANEKLREFGKVIDGKSRPDAVRYWSKAERGESVGDPTMDAGNALLHQVTEHFTNELVRLDRLKAEATIANYIGRFWSKPDNPKAANFLRSIFGKRPLEGPKSFTKQRSLERFTDGLAAGLVPATYNYVKSQLAKIAEMQRVIAAERMMRAEQASGRAKPVMLGAEPPRDDSGDLWQRIGDGTDPAFTVYGPSDVTHFEAVDTIVYGKLQKLLGELKISHERKVRIGGNRLGYAQSPPMEGIVTKFGGPEGVLMHELGHILDWRYKLADTIDDAIGKAPKRKALKGKKAGQEVPDYKNEPKEARERRQLLRNELRELANLRRETLQGVPATKDLHPSDRAYLHSKAEKMANLVEAYIHARDRFKAVAPGIYDIFDKVVEKHSELQALRDIKPSLSREAHYATTNVGGPVIRGHWYAPKSAAAVWNAHLSRGLRGNPLYDAYMAPAQAAAQMLLSFSGFHFTVIATEGVFSDLALGIDSLANKGGDISQTLPQIARSLAAPVRTARLGARVMKEYRIPGTHPELARVIDAMIAGGYRGTAKSEIWTGERRQKLKDAFREAVRAESGGRRLWGATKAAVDAAWAGIELVNWPLMEKYVPLMKTGATYSAVAQALAKLPENATMDEVHRVMSDVTKEMDYRFGQVVYENHFINNTVKHLAQMLFLAPGWTFGTIALASRGVRDVARPVGAVARRLRLGGSRGQQGQQGAEAEPPPPELIGKSAAYWIGAVLGTMAINGFLTWANTKEKPHGKDYFAFRDGTLDAEGNPNRHTIPGYLMHDVYGWSHHPVQTFKNKLSPALTFMERMADNKDFFGDKIYDPDASLPEKVTDVAKAVKQEFAPLSVQNYLEGRQRGEGGAGELTRDVFGVTPAKREFVRTAAQNKMHEYLADQRSVGGRTPDQAALGRDKQKLRQQLRDGRATGDTAAVSDAKQKIRQMEMAGDLTVRQARLMVKGSREDLLVTEFKKLSFDQAVHVYELANESERAVWFPLFRKKAANSGRIQDFRKLNIERPKQRLTAP